MIAMIGTSDRLCWLAETCKILLLHDNVRSGLLAKPASEVNDLTCHFRAIN